MQVPPDLASPYTSLTYSLLSDDKAQKVYLHSKFLATLP